MCSWEFLWGVLITLGVVHSLITGVFLARIRKKAPEFLRRSGVRIARGSWGIGGGFDVVLFLLSRRYQGVGDRKVRILGDLAFVTSLLWIATWVVLLVLWYTRGFS